MSKLNDHSFLVKPVSSYIDKKLARWGGPKYAYTIINKADLRDALIVSTYPDKWLSIYRKNNLQRIDPVIRSALNRTSPFVWGNNSALFCNLYFIKKFIRDANYQLTYGFTFVLHDHKNRVALLSMITSVNDSELEKSIITERSTIQILLIDIHEQMYKFHNAKNVNIASVSTYEKNVFTVRENEVLYWSSMGKTYGEIAIIIGITLRTVKFHMGNVVRKLGAVNARQAIRLGIELNLIRPPF